MERRSRGGVGRLVKRVVLALLALVAVLLTGLVAVRLAEGLERGDDDAPLPVEARPAERGELTQTFVATGKVEPVRDVQISARVSARVLELPHEEGDAVEPGALLVRLDASELEAELEAATNRRDGLRASIAVEEAQIRASRASRVAAEQTLELARRDLQRQTRLAGTGDIAGSLLEEAELAAAEADASIQAQDARIQAAEEGLAVTRFNIAAAEADMRRIREQLTDTEIRSPMAGTITELNVEEGEVAVTGTMNNPGTVLLTVADLSGLRVVTQISETDVASVETGQEAKVTMPAFGSRVFPGRVERIALSMNGGNSRNNANNNDAGTFEARVELLELPPMVRTGLTAEVEIVAETFKDAVLVPSQAVLSVALTDLPEGIELPETTAGGQAPRRDIALVVYTLDGDRAQPIPVAIGPADGRNTLITAGLEAGTPIITGPYLTLSNLNPGAPIVPPGGGDAGPGGEAAGGG